MLKISRIIFCAVLVITVSIACEGPSGSEGSEGIEGPEGPVGPAGEDGSMMYAGEGEPGDDIGDIDDYYLDQNTGELYGPKDSDGWGDPIIVLMGEDGDDGTDGQDGKDGSQIYSGSGAPDASLGVKGDYYLNKDSYELYGPKTSNGWGTPLNLKGADGNANVTRYIFPGHDFTTNNINLEFDGPTYNITDSNMRESAWYVYFVASSGSVYHIPGYGISQSTHYSAHHTYQGVVMYMSLRVVDGPGEEYEEIEVVRVESSDAIDMTKQKSQNILPDGLDVSNYQAVAEYYGFYK